MLSNLNVLFVKDFIILYVLKENISNWFICMLRSCIFLICGAWHFPQFLSADKMSFRIGSSLRSSRFQHHLTSALVMAGMWMIICEIKQLKQVPSSTTPMKSRLVVVVIGRLFRQQFRFLIRQGFMRYCVYCVAWVAYARGRLSTFLITKQLQICSTLISIRGKGRAELVYCPSTPEGTSLQQLGLTLWVIWDTFLDGSESYYWPKFDTRLIDT